MKSNLLQLMITILFLSRVSTEPYYVTPSTSVPCSDEDCPCYTLTEYASKPNNYFTSNTSFIFLPGNHNLDSNLEIENGLSLTITTTDSNVTVTCTKPAALYFDNIETISVSNLEFLGCRITVTLVQNLNVSNCNFQGQGQYNTGMDLAFVMSAFLMRSTFSFNTGIMIQHSNDTEYVLFLGGAIYASESNVYIIESFFDGNTAQFGGAVCVWNSTLEVQNSTFKNNRAIYSETPINRTLLNVTEIARNVASYFFEYNNTKGGAVYIGNTDNFTHIITNTHFVKNRADHGGGGAIYIDRNHNNVYVQSTVFSHNYGYNAGALYVDSENNTVFIINTQFISNRVHQYGGAIIIEERNMVHINGTKFISNRAVYAAGALAIFGPNSAYIFDSKFIKNTVLVSAGAVTLDGGEKLNTTDSMISSIVIQQTLFVQNTAVSIGGALSIRHSHVHICDTNFIHNAAAAGGAILALSANITSTGLLNIQENNGYQYSVVTLLKSTLTKEGTLTFWKNNGSLLAIQTSNVTLAGYSQFIQNVAKNPSNALYLEGGAISCSLSKIIFTGITYIANNEAENGGAILATDSHLYMYNNVTLANNQARKSGGAIYAYQSELLFWGETLISGNEAINKGGGMFLLSTIVVYVKGYFAHYNNRARLGGAVFLETNSKLHVEKLDFECETTTEWNCTYSDPSTWLRLEFDSNTANYGGAIYVSDETISSTCAILPLREGKVPTGECFLQITSVSPITQENTVPVVSQHIRNVYFYNNSATFSGGVIYGGLLDRCELAPATEIIMKYHQQSNTIDGMSYFLNITNLQIEDFEKQSRVTSDPVRICFCHNNELDCNYHPQTVVVRKGQTFRLSMAAVDQVTKIVPHTFIRSSLSSSQGGLRQGDSIQKTNFNCTDLTYNVFSLNSSEKLIIYAEGPCKDLGISKKEIEIEFEACPNGFVESITGGCQCDSWLYPEYVLNCSVDDASVMRKGNVWIAFTTHTSYIAYKYCPLEYCLSKLVDVDVESFNGSDSQCAFNRSGKLCGSCKDGLSVSLGSSHCLSCTNSWLALISVFAIAGIALVAFLLVCNLTVAVGTINGLVFYANVVAANKTVFIPFNKSNVLTIFVAWLNLDFGFLICFYDGMDGYAKTWLQFAFPAYTILLVVAIILLSAYSQRFARMISNRNPVATLATLILFSYAKLLRTIIAALSFATLDYSDGSKELVWLVDGNVPYLKGKHIPLFIAALFINLVGLVYTLFLFSWMWLLRCPNWRLLRWLRNTKLHSFMDAYNAPYSAKHRYWTGLLLLVRAILYVISALNVFGDPSFNLLLITCAITSLLLLNTLTERVYKNKLLNGLESSFLYNLIIFSVATLYLQKSQGNQEALAYTSTSIAFVTFLAILIYHTIHMFVLCVNKRKKIKSSDFEHQPSGKNDDRNPLLRNPGHARYEELHSTFGLPFDPITEDDTLEETAPTSKRPHVVTYTEVSLDSEMNS